MKEIRKSRRKAPVEMWMALALIEIEPAVHRSLVDDGILEVLKDIITDPNISVNSVDEQVCDPPSAAYRMIIKQYSVEPGQSVLGSSLSRVVQDNYESVHDNQSNGRSDRWGPRFPEENPSIIRPSSQIS